MRSWPLLLLFSACIYHPMRAEDDTTPLDDAGDFDASIDDAPQPQDDAAPPVDSGTTTQTSTNVSILVEPNGTEGPRGFLKQGVTFAVTRVLGRFGPFALLPHNFFFS